MTWLGLAAAAAVGAVLRLVVTSWGQGRGRGPAGGRGAAAYPLGTLLVNATGSLLLGLLVGLAGADRLGAAGLVVLGTGFCGALTTYSAVAVESLALLREERPGAAAGYLAGSVGLACLLATAGVAVGSRF